MGGASRISSEYSFDECQSMISVEKYPNNTKTSNRRLNKSYHAGSEHTVRSKRSRRSYPGDQRLMPSAGSKTKAEWCQNDRTRFRNKNHYQTNCIFYANSSWCCLPYLCHCKIAPYSRRKKAKCLD